MSWAEAIATVDGGAWLSFGKLVLLSIMFMQVLKCLC